VEDVLKAQPGGGMGLVTFVKMHAAKRWTDPVETQQLRAALAVLIDALGGPTNPAVMTLVQHNPVLKVMLGL
jgi:hypothetical protein